MTEWRLLADEHRKASENMAIDESMLRHRLGTGMNTLRFFGWEPSAISIGYFQGLEQEVDTEACRERGVDIVRRITGGGAVYHDTVGEVTYSIVMPVDDPLVKGLDILGSYEVLCAGLVDGLARLGITAEFKPVNDIIANGRKISGNAQTRRSGCILQHGTVLIDVDPDLMFTLLKVPDEKIRDKMIAAVEDRVTSIGREAGEVERSDVVEALKEGFASTLDAELVPLELTAAEMAAVPEIEAERFGNPEWTGRR